jgi:hypothetical protein
LENGDKNSVASRNYQFLSPDPLPLDLLRRRHVGMVYAASWIGTNLNDLSALPAIHDNRLGHLVTGFLVSRELGACAVRLGFFDLQLDVLILSQRSALAGIPRRCNLYSLRLGFQSPSHASVNLGWENSRAKCIMWNQESSR